MKFAVIVDSKTGNTRQCADWIVQGMKSLKSRSEGEGAF